MRIQLKFKTNFYKNYKRVFLRESSWAKIISGIAKWHHFNWSFFSIFNMVQQYFKVLLRLWTRLYQCTMYQLRTHDVVHISKRSVYVRTEGFIPMSSIIQVFFIHARHKFNTPQQFFYCSTPILTRVLPLTIFILIH